MASGLEMVKSNLAKIGGHHPSDFFLISRNHMINESRDSLD